MVIGNGIIKKEDVVYVFPDTFHGNNIPAGTGWAKIVEKCNNKSTTMSVKLDVDELLYHNKALKDVTNVEILKIMYSETQKERKYHENLVKKATKK